MLDLEAADNRQARTPTQVNFGGREHQVFFPFNIVWMHHTAFRADVTTGRGHTCTNNGSSGRVRRRRARLYLAT